MKKVPGHTNLSFNFLRLFIIQVYERAVYEDLLLGKYCGNISAADISTSFNALIVIFHTDLGINYKGFNVTYSHYYGTTT